LRIGKGCSDRQYTIDLDKQVGKSHYQEVGSPINYNLAYERAYQVLYKEEKEHVQKEGRVNERPSHKKRDDTKTTEREREYKREGQDKRETRQKRGETRQKRDGRSIPQS
jgi:hypothetical protein